MLITSKLLAFAAQPLSWVLVMLAFGLLVLNRWRGFATLTLWCALLLLAGIGWQPLPEALIRNLESRHPAPQTDLKPFAGVVVLGGALEPSYVWSGHGQPALNERAERMTAALPLMQKYPGFQLVFSGGDAEWLTPGISEAERARRFYTSMGLDAQRVLYESESRNTHENATFSAALPGVDKTRPWLLLTSAWHMPRALATFKKAGWNVTPWPVDQRSGLDTPWTEYSLAKGARAWELVLHEWFGIQAYEYLGYL